MDAPKAPVDLVDEIYAISVKPDRLLDLVEQWDARIEIGDPELGVRLAGYSDALVVRHLERALEILDELSAFEFGRLDDMLSGMPSASMVLSDRGTVVAANEPAQLCFGLYPGSSIAQMPLAAPALDDLAEWLATVAAGPEPRDDIVQLCIAGRERPALMHLRALDSGRARRHVLAVTSEYVWRDAAAGVLARVFGLTPAEIALVRRIVAGDTLQGIALSGGRREGRLRSQLHSVLAKTGVRSQGELARLGAMLLQAVSFDPAATRRPSHAEVLAGDRRPRHLTLADGRRLAVLEYGDPRGRPVLWLQSAIGLYQPTPAGEREMIRRGLRTVVAIRAGYATSDPAPPGRDLVEGTARDCAEVLDQAGIDRCPVIATTYDLRLALELARIAPARVEAIVSVSTMFPIRNLAHFRRLNLVGRFYVATIRYAPHVLPFVVRAWHADMRRNGMHASIRKVYRDTPADTRAFADPAIAKAMTSAYGQIYAADSATAQAAFCADAVRFERPWPPGTGEVGCPVTLVHGEEDGSGPYETALDYCASHPAWRCITYPGEGQLIAFTRLGEILDLLAEAPVPAVAGA